MDPFVAEIRILPFNFPPKGWSRCDGQLLPISQNTALFSLLGTTYGGDGKSTFALPNLAGNVPMHPGQGPGLSERFLGETGGSASVTLLTSEIPSHNHSLKASSSDGTLNTPVQNGVLAISQRGSIYTTPTSTKVEMGSNALAPNGGGSPHNNMMPFLTVNFCIALQGVFPPRG